MAPTGDSQREFIVADLDARGELRAQAMYRYEDLEKIPNAAELIVGFSTAIWRSPESFEMSLTGNNDEVHFRWRASAPSAGMATIRCRQTVVSISLLLTGIDADADQITLTVFQRHLLQELHDTGYEPAFDLVSLVRRPMVATINIYSPEKPEHRMTVALADRCFAASYFRYHQLI